MSRPWIRAAFWLLAALVCLPGAARARNSLPGAFVSLVWRAGTVAPTDVERMFERASLPVRIAAWKTPCRQEVDGLLASEVSVAIYYGDMRLLTGDTLLRGNPDGCALSEQAAQALFASANAIGRTVTIEGKEHIVSGVFAHGQADVLLNWDGAGELRCERVALAFPQTDRALWRELALAIAGDTGLSGADTLLDGALLFSLARLESPRWMIPTRWSDFAAWRRAFDSVSERIRLTLRAEHSPLDSAMVRGAGNACLIQIAFSYCMVKVLIRLRGCARAVRRPFAARYP